MGSDWSCPCTDRERVKHKLPKTNDNELVEEHFPHLGLRIKSINPKKLAKFTKSLQSECIISSISNHPTTENALIILQLESELEFLYIPGSGFDIISYRFTSPDELAGEIQKRHSQGYFFIGGVYNGKDMLLVYYETENRQESRITVKMEIDVTFSDLKVIFQEETDNLFLGCIQYKERALLIFEQSQTPRPITYLVADFPKEEIESTEFEIDLAYKINECITKNNVHFRGCVAYNHSLYLIFIQ